MTLPATHVIRLDLRRWSPLGSLSTEPRWRPSGPKMAPEGPLQVWRGQVIHPHFRFSRSHIIRPHFRFGDSHMTRPSLPVWWESRDPHPLLVPQVSHDPTHFRFGGCHVIRPRGASDPSLPNT